MTTFNLTIASVQKGIENTMTLFSDFGGRRNRYDSFMSDVREDNFEYTSTLVQMIADANLGMASDIANSVLRYKKCSFKQAYWLAKAAIENFASWFVGNAPLRQEWMNEYFFEAVEVEDEPETVEAVEVEAENENAEEKEEKEETSKIENMITYEGKDLVVADVATMEEALSLIEEKIGKVTVTFNAETADGAGEYIIGEVAILDEDEDAEEAELRCYVYDNNHSDADWWCTCGGSDGFCGRVAVIMHKKYIDTINGRKFERREEEWLANITICPTLGICKK